MVDRAVYGHSSVRPTDRGGCRPESPGSQDQRLLPGDTHGARRHSCGLSVRRSLPPAPGAVDAGEAVSCVVTLQPWKVVVLDGVCEKTTGTSRSQPGAPMAEQPAADALAATVLPNAMVSY